MTGPEHYRIAERLVAKAMDINNDLADNPRPPRVHEAMNAGMRQLVEFAQVHATLALTAATAQNIRRNGAVDAAAGGNWEEVLGG